MKTFFSFLPLIFLPFTSVLSHGIGGHFIREEERHSPHDGHDHSGDGKTLSSPIVTEESRWWGASLSTGWTSREVHYGVDETGNYGAYITELNLRLGHFNVGVWSGFGTGNDYQEWDFSASYNFVAGPVFFVPGYNFRYTPGVSHSGESHEDHEEEDHEHHEDHASHTHKTYGHELFFVLGTTSLKYVTPSMTFVWDLSNTPGAYLDFRLDGDIPLHRDIITLNPYALLSLNLGYNTRRYYGWNNFQFGLEAVWRINRTISVVGGVNYSVAMTALRDIGQDNIVWANTAIRFEY